MGRTPVISREDVFAAAERLAAEGKPVKARAVRELLEGGSYTTIYAHIDEWAASKKAAPPITVAMPDHVKGLMDQLWAAASQEVAKETAALRAQADAATADALTKLDEARSVIAALEDQGAADAELIASFQAALEAERQAAEQKQLAAAIKEAELGAANAALLAQLTEAQTLLAERHNQYAATSRQLGEAHSTLSARDQQLTDVRGQLAQAVDKLNHLSTEQKLQTATRAKQMGDQAQELMVAKELLRLKEEELQAARTNLQTSQQACENLLQKVMAAHTEAEQHAAALGTARGESRALREQLDRMAETVLARAPQATARRKSPG